MRDGLNVGLSFDDVVRDPSFTEEITGRGWHPGEYCDLYQWLVEFMDSVLSADQIPYEIRDDGFRRWAVRNTKTQAGKRNLTGYLRWCWAFMDLYWPDCSYSPDFQLYFDCYRSFAPIQLSLAERVIRDDPSALFPDGTILAERFNAFVAYLREQARAKNVRKKMLDWKAGLKHQGKVVRDYLVGLVKKHPNLLPVRLDFLYTVSAAVESEALLRTSWERNSEGLLVSVPSALPEVEGRLETRGRIDVRQAMRDRAAFFDRSCGPALELFDFVAGFICKMEQGSEHRAYHLHTVLLFDATKVKESDIERLIGLASQRWQHVTGGAGLVFNCHDEDYKAGLKREGAWSLDPIRKGNAEQIEKLVEYIDRYFTKDDGQMLRVKPTAKSRTLTKGQ
ncbi:inovirus Gp2 family protein [Ralstonia solanacearum]|nr:inovirus Gp2 family protein [Ralstonia solanacearum]NKA93107.1 inovirus Gp2 family protein [Ralstonia solanacearum]